MGVAAWLVIALLRRWKLARLAHWWVPGPQNAGWSHSEVYFQLPRAHTCTCRCPHTHQEKHWSLSKSPTAHLWMLQRYVFPKFPELPIHFHGMGIITLPSGTTIQHLAHHRSTKHCRDWSWQDMPPTQVQKALVPEKWLPQCRGPVPARTINYFSGP